ncbi:MAG: O-antigen ligase family protein [Flavobacteriales bacterium]|nr:O-antigen ligase family protein [Flavobacteriales bacterium]
MEISKRSLINTLFLAGMPVYGIGFYIGARFSFSAGMIISILPYVAIILVHLLDLMYRGHAVRMVNRVYWVALLCLLSMVSGMWIAYFRGFPGYDPFNTTMQSLMILLPFQGAVITQIVNRDNDGFNFATMFLKSIVFLILINFLGFAGGLSNLVHAFPGRVNLPFMRGLYDAAHLLSLINLMLLFHIKDFTRRPGTFLGLSLFYMVNMAVMISVNSRLSFLVFLILTVLFFSRILRTARFLYPISLFTVPLLLSFALLIYQILTLPMFSAILSRVSKSDVTTFNGRSYIWYAAWEWITTDRREFFFGAGYNGQYWLGLMDKVGVIWDVKKPIFIHMHSSALQILMAQGVVGWLLMCICMWYVYSYFRRKYVTNGLEAPLFAAVVYFLFIWQVDIFVYGLDIGVPLLFSLLSYIAIDDRFITRTPTGEPGTPALT